MKTLIIIDAQNDFMPGGSLEVPNGDAIIPVINASLNQFDLVIATQDWHPGTHNSFASNHVGKKPFEKIILNGLEQVLWPDHCVQGTVGAEFHPELETRAIETIFRKGTDPIIDSYSGFYDNGHLKSTGLAGYLREKEASDLYFAGLCADICVFYSIKDALKEGFNCWLIEDATCPLNKNEYSRLKAGLLKERVKIIKSNQL
ncbi:MULTISPECIES: bifunctional nicotinamidase/pyrazinamidase [unclassified Legionella]|uniref:bifunctional nicotinamidase/pyrazinamidase n=1 Tax=unclassified Legionella TaxID=2622702 RepID=UPI0010554D5E|nr:MULTISPECIES: bifunctional nicotinamidase/pyrazinamidase [unclassified Legionella]MDI9818240.1 bifunctional nicotinamidase/pyrazinamidase [Legionella sp. PL877]